MVFVERKKYLEENRIEIIAFWSMGDLVDFFPQNELAYDKKTNFDIVPTNDQVRLYMRYKAI